jgi:hypothetical protein
MSIAASNPSSVFDPPRAASRGATARPFTLSRLLRSGLLMGGLSVAMLVVGVLGILDGLEYYRTPLSIRAYSPAHRLLRPSGPVGQTFGVVGAAMMLVPFAYAMRKRYRWMRFTGPQNVWLEVHLFCGIVGPALVTFHTSFKFNGVVSVAYWSMVLVMLSGFAGRFLYLRIPRSLRGVELTRAELDARAAELDAAMTSAAPVGPLRDRLARFTKDAAPSRVTTLGLLVGEFAIGRRTRALDAEMARAAVPLAIRQEVLALTVERARLVTRVAYLERTKKLFAMWHVFHLPLVWLMLAIVAVHVAAALYLGYAPFRW